MRPRDTFLSGHTRDGLVRLLKDSLKARSRTSGARGGTIFSELTARLNRLRRSWGLRLILGGAGVYPCGAVLRAGFKPLGRSWCSETRSSATSEVERSQHRIESEFFRSLLISSREFPIRVFCSKFPTVRCNWLEWELGWSNVEERKQISHSTWRPSVPARPSRSPDSGPKSHVFRVITRQHSHCRP